MTASPPRTPQVRVPPAERPNRTMRVIDTLVEHGFLPLARSVWSRRRPVGHVDRDLAVVVTAVETVADDVRTVTLARTTGEALPRWFPGAHLDLVLPSGRIRQYSLTGRRDDPTHWRIAVRHIRIGDGGGGGSAEVHRLQVGDRLIARGPREAFPFVHSEQGYLFVAGGIGITPILPMLRRTARRDLVPWTLVYTGRTRASMPFLDEIAAITAAHPDRVHVLPDDEYGVPQPDHILALAPTGAALYTCGPPPMIDALRRAMPDPQIDSLHFERFSAPPVIGGRPFEIRLARSGVAVTVGAEETALTAVRRVRPAQAYSCQQGFCGTCQVRVLDGIEDTHLRLCVARSDGPITLDL